MASNPIGAQERILFGEDFELEVASRRLRRGGRMLKLERIPLEILVLLIERRGEIVTRDQIVARVWGKGAFLDTDNSIRGAIRKIRQALKDDPEYPRFIQTVTGQGYRFIAPLIRPEEGNHAAKDQSSVVPNIAHLHLERTRKTPISEDREYRSRNTSRGRWLVSVGAVLLALLAVAYIATRTRSRGTTGPKIGSLAVLPLKNLSGDPTQEYLADGMTESLIGRLSLIRGLRVISRTSVMGFKDTHLSLPEIAKTLHVDAIVEGSVVRQNDRIRIYAQLIRAQTDEHFWSETYDRELRDALTLQNEVAQSIAQKVEVTVTGEERVRLVAARYVAPEVYESYLKGQFALAKSTDEISLEESIGHFEDTTKRDPNFAPAYVGLASAHEKLSSIFVGAPVGEERQQVVSAAQKALELDPDLAEAHVLLAEMKQREWHWAEAEAEYKRALDLKPNDAMAHLGLADWLMCQGRMDEALERARRGREA
jgi:TolB-like protein/DNA-binding winged helix-turn-helix (wHTH) protein